MRECVAILVMRLLCVHVDGDGQLNAITQERATHLILEVE